jgi:N-acetylmuramoyl-L-alanine amidase
VILIRGIIKFCVVVILLLLVPLTLPEKVQANQKITVIMNNEEVTFDEPLIIQDGRINVPIRFLTEKMGSDVRWEETDQSVRISTPIQDEVKLYIGNKSIFLNQREFILDVPPIIKEGRTYLPLRHIAEMIHHQVSWEDQSMVASFSSQPLYEIQEGDTLQQIATKMNVDLEQLKDRNHLISEEIKVGQKLKIVIPGFMKNNLAIELLAKIIHAEAGYEPFEGKLAVGNVIMNRVFDSQFPKTIFEVIYEPFQFSPATNGKMDKITPNEGSWIAAKQAWQGENIVPGALYFFNPKVTQNSFFSSRKVVSNIGNHRFTY